MCRTVSSIVADMTAPFVNTLQGNSAMILPLNPFRVRSSQPGTFKFASCALLALVLAVSVIMVGCAAPTDEPAAPDYAATVQILLPTAEPTEPPTPTPTAMPTPEAPTATSRPTDSPEPTATLRPTYTPRPLPAPAGVDGSGERERAIPFQARLLDGSDLLLADTIGAPTLLAFWAPW